MVLVIHSCCNLCVYLIMHKSTVTREFESISIARDFVFANFRDPDKATENAMRRDKERQLSPSRKKSFKRERKQVPIVLIYTLSQQYVCTFWRSAHEFHIRFIDLLSRTIESLNEAIFCRDNRHQFTHKPDNSFSSTQPREVFYFREISSIFFDSKGCPRYPSCFHIFHTREIFALFNRQFLLYRTRSRAHRPSPRVRENFNYT